MRNVNPTTIRFTDEDKAIIAQLKRRYGVTSTVEVVRLSLRLAAERSADRSVHTDTPDDDLTHSETVSK